MDQDRVAELLVSDLHANIQWFEFGALIIGCVLLIISSVLAARAYGVLSEARLTAYRAGGARLGAEKGFNRQSTAENINAASRRQRARSHQRTLP